jgi:hypothetical protein
MLDDDGEFQWPSRPGMGAGDEAAWLARTGRDPASAGPGPMDEPDVPPNEDDEDDGEGG